MLAFAQFLGRFKDVTRMRKQTLQVSPKTALEHQRSGGSASRGKRLSSSARTTNCAWPTAALFSLWRNCAVGVCCILGLYQTRSRTGLKEETPLRFKASLCFAAKFFQKLEASTATTKSSQLHSATPP